MTARSSAAEAVEALRPRLSVGSRVIADDFERSLCRRDLARLPGFMERALLPRSPLLVVQPRTQDDVLVLTEFCRERGLALFARGVSSSAFGGAVPTEAGVVADFSSMNRVLSVDPAARTATVEPGVRWADLVDAVSPHGLAPRTTPTGLFSTVAGWVSTGGRGLNGFKYGPLREAVQGMRVVMPCGEVWDLKSSDPRMADFFGAEGQLGLITELTLALRPAARESHPLLFYFDDDQRASSFLEAVIASQHKPTHLQSYDAARLKEENALFKDKTGLKDDIVEAQSAVLLHFDDAASAGKFLEHKGLPPHRVAAVLAARYLWSERFYPMKAQRRGPGMLASEVLLPHGRLPAYLADARRLAQRFGDELACETSFHQSQDSLDSVVILTFLCDPAGADYPLRLLLVQLLTHAALTFGGRPYGIGLWNLPFVRSRRSALKAQVDPHNLLNPHKSLSRPGFFSLRDWILQPILHVIGLRLARWFSPLLGLAARGLARPTGEAWSVPDAAASGPALLKETAERCTACGSCIAVCPAWIVTREELTTARGKLEAAQALGHGLSAEAAQSMFQCVHCGLCEEVCQTALPLRACYDVLEKSVALLHGRPDKLIADFAARVDKISPEVAQSYGLLRPEWRPGTSR